MVFHNITFKNIFNEGFRRCTKYVRKDPEFKYFMLDAQGSLLDDYIKWRPEDEARIKRLVQAH